LFLGIIITIHVKVLIKTHNKTTMKKMKIYFYGEIYNIRNSYDIYKKETKSGEEKIYEYNRTQNKKIRTSVKK
jgi:hypothetical protein|tara:strand:- start:45 stop:263 length:219 start_codon:yes stop_codon:yes gene_type:complete